MNKLNAYERSRMVLAFNEAAKDFADVNALVEWAKGPRRRKVSAVALARLESVRDAYGRRCLKIIEAMPAEMFRRPKAKG